MINPLTMKVTISRDVIFEEDGCWNWGRTDAESKSEVLVWGEADEETLEELNEHENENTTTEAEEDNLEAIDSSSNESVTPPNLEKRVRRVPTYLQDYTSGGELSEDEVHNFLMFMSTDDPIYYEEAVKKKNWRDAMNKEIAAIRKNQTWELVQAPSEAKIIGVKSVYKTKLDENGEVSKCKAHLVAKGYAQEKGVDYDEVFAPVARWDTIRMVIALAARNGWKLYQLDVKSAFLHGELHENVYVSQPQGYEVKGEESKVYKLKRALYGLKQAPRAWFSRIESYFVNEGFEGSCYEHTLFIKKEEDKILIVSLYVDDLIFTSNDLIMMQSFKTSMKREFEMIDLGKMKYFLGVEVRQNARGIHISQKKYAGEVLDRFGMGSCNGVKNPIVPGSIKLSKREEGKQVDGTLFK